MAGIHRKTRGNREAGQTLFLMAMSLVVLVGMLGLGIDLGAMRYEKRLQQTAADAAAIAGASDLSYGGVAPAAQAAAAANGFDSGGDTNISDCTGRNPQVGKVCVEVNNPPQESQTHNDNANSVEVLVSAVRPTYFMRIFGKKMVTVTARAVAESVGGGPSKPCLLALSASVNALVVNGTINLTACSLIVNGNLQINGQINAGAGSSIEVAGTCSGSCSGVVTGIPAAADPLANLQTPPPDGCSSGGLLGLLNFLNFCQGTVGAGVNLDFAELTNPSSLYTVPGTGGLSLGINAAVNAPTETLYVPNGPVSFPVSGAATVTANAMIVAQPLDVSAGVTLTLGGSENPTITNAVLVE